MIVVGILSILVRSLAQAYEPHVVEEKDPEHDGDHQTQDQNTHKHVVLLMKPVENDRICGSKHLAAFILELSVPKAFSIYDGHHDLVANDETVSTD